MRIDDLMVCNNLSEIRDRKIIIYGTGLWGNAVYNCLLSLGIKEIYICNTKKSDDLFYGKRILSIDQIRNQYDVKETMIIVSSVDYFDDMIEECRKLNFMNAKVCTVFSFFTSLKMHYLDKGFPRELRKQIENNLIYSNKKYELVYKTYVMDMFGLVANSSDETVLVYQPGKVASQSVWNSIKDKSIQIHTIAMPYACEEFDAETRAFYLQSIQNKKKIKIISGVREPISRDISAMFQCCSDDLWPYNSINHSIFWWYSDYINEKKALDAAEIDERFPCWRKNMNDSFGTLSHLIVQKELDEFSWFDYEIKAIFGVDVYQYPFNKEKGYGIIREKNIEIFLYRMENLSELQEEIASFLGDHNFSLNSINYGESKIYKYLYKDFKKSIRLSEEYFNYYYRDFEKYKHFYSEKQIKEFAEFWKNHTE